MISEKLITYLDHVYSVDGYDERKPRWNAAQILVQNWFNAQQVEQEEVSSETLAFLHRVRDTIPSPYTLEKFKEEFMSFKKLRPKLSGVTTGRTSGKHKSDGNIPRTNVSPAVDTVLHSSTFETQTYHHPSPSYDCSPSDSGSSDGGGGGCGD